MITEKIRAAHTNPFAGVHGPDFAGSAPTHVPGVEIAVEPVSLGVDGVCANQTLMLAFDADTGMVVSYSLVAPKCGVRDAARTAIDALKELHIAEDVEIDITCGRFPAPLLVGEIKRMSGRLLVAANDGWTSMLCFDSAAAEIGRQVRGVAAYELAAGWSGFEGPEERRFFLECVVDQVLYWYHRRPSAPFGSKSPIERLAERNAGQPASPSRI